jgi:transposase InsO family protein
MVTKELGPHGFKLPGRDQFFEILREHNLMVPPRKSQFPHTTYSRHQYAVQPNRLKNLAIIQPLQVLVSDVTYLRAGDGFCYLFLTTDIFSRKIVGWHLSENLEHYGAIAALKKALEEIPNPSGLIHHSDRGVQYCCHEFLEELERQSMLSSMTDADHAAQNAIAERINGILKNEFLLDVHFLRFSDAQKAVNEAIKLYNGFRPHSRLGMATPSAFHAQKLAA